MGIYNMSRCLLFSTRLYKPLLSPERPFPFSSQINLSPHEDFTSIFLSTSRTTRHQFWGPVLQPVPSGCQVLSWNRVPSWSQVLSRQSPIRYRVLSWSLVSSWSWILTSEKCFLVTANRPKICDPQFKYSCFCKQFCIFLKVMDFFSPKIMWISIKHLSVSSVTHFSCILSTGTNQKSILTLLRDISPVSFIIGSYPIQKRIFLYNSFGKLSRSGCIMIGQTPGNCTFSGVNGLKKTWAVFNSYKPIAL